MYLIDSILSSAFFSLLLYSLTNITIFYSICLTISQLHILAFKIKISPQNLSSRLGYIWSQTIILLVDFHLQTFLQINSSQKMGDQQKHEQNCNQIVYLISQNFNAPHIQMLLQVFNNNKIPVQLQKDHQSLGVNLDRRYFVLVDNLQGTIILGSWFSSLLLFIVGYPKIGKNKKNHYCSKPQQVLKKYKQFCQLPEFVKKNFLSSNVASKLALKSSFSIRSNSRAASDANSTQKSKIVQNPIKSELKSPKLDKSTKLLLFLSLKDTSYNKWIFKIAANNRKKFQLVENLEDLQLTLSVCRGRQNFLVISSDQYNCIAKKGLSNLKIIVFSRQGEFKQKENVVGVCVCQSSLIACIREAGFQVVSLRDIEKSIVKYDNPFAKQVKSNTSRRIVWDSDSKKQIETQKQGQQKLNLCYSIKITKQNEKSAPLIIKQTSSDNQSFQSFKMSSVVRSISTQSAPQNQKKRMSIDSQVRKNQQSQKKNSNIQYNIKFASSQPVTQFGPKQQKNAYASTLPVEVSLITPVPIMNLPPNNKHVPHLAIEKSTRKIIKLKPSKSVDSKNELSCLKGSIKINENSQQNSKIFKKKATESDTYQPVCNPHKSIFIQKQNKGLAQIISSKTSIIFDETGQRQNKNSKESDSASSATALKRGMRKSPCSKTLKKSILAVQQSTVKKKNVQLTKTTLRNQYQIYNTAESVCLNQSNDKSIKHLILWKDFNFLIENNKNYLTQQLNHTLTDKSFSAVNQFGSYLLQSKQHRVIVMLDQVDIQKYLQVIKQHLVTKKFLSIYIFQKMQKNKANFISNLKQLLNSKGYEKLKPIVKPVIINQYFDEGLQVAKEIVSWVSQGKNTRQNGLQVQAS